MYAGPVGWFGGMGSEFAVGIRSSLVEPKSNYANNGTNGIQKVLYDRIIFELYEADLIRLMHFSKFSMSNSSLLVIFHFLTQ